MTRGAEASQGSEVDVLDVEVLKERRRRVFRARTKVSYQVSEGDDPAAPLPNGKTSSTKSFKKRTSFGKKISSFSFKEKSFGKRKSKPSRKKQWDYETIDDRSKNSKLQELEASEIITGSVAFLHRNRRPAKWAKVYVDAPKPGAPLQTKLLEMNVEGKSTNLDMLLFDLWRLPKPSVLISVTGENGDALSAELKEEFRRGLTDTVESTGAWVTTDGVDSGIAKIVGQCLRELDAVCIGFASWGRISGVEALQNAANEQTGSIAMYEPKRSVGEFCLERLDPNLTHFMLVSDGSNEQSATKWLRDAVEEAVCKDNRGSSELIGVPKVVLVVGGDLETLRLVKKTLLKERPVVVLPESGGAARMIFEACFMNEDSGFVGQRRGSVAEAAPVSEEEELLSEIKRLTLLGSSASGEPIQFFSLHEPFATPGLRDILLRALLDDLKEVPTDAIRLAVAWKDPAIIRDELEDIERSEERNNSGLVRAFQLALSMAECDVVRVLIEFKADPTRLQFNNLVRCDWLQPTDPLILKLDQYDNLIVKSETAQITEGDPRFDARSRVGFTVLLDQLGWYFGYHDYLTYRSHDSLATYDLWVEAHMEESSVFSPLPSVSAPQSGTVPVGWLELTIWAALCGRPELAKILWAQTTDPLRVALMASLLCRQLSKEKADEKQTTLVKHAEEYESWAVGMIQALPAVHSEADRENDLRDELDLLLEGVPCKEVGADDKTGFKKGSLQKWPESPIGLAIGRGDTKCQHLLELKPVMDFFEDHFCGYQVWPLNQSDGDQDGDGIADSVDPDYVDQARRWVWPGETVTVTYGTFMPFLRCLVPSFAAREMGLWRSSLHSLSIFQIPKVKYWLHTLFSVAYLVLIVAQLLGGWPWVGASEWMRREGRLNPKKINAAELLNWIWAVSRGYDECKQMYRLGKEGYQQTQDRGLAGAMRYFAQTENIKDMFICSILLVIAVLRALAYYDAFDEHERLCVASFVRTDSPVCIEVQLDAVMAICQSLYAIAVVLVFYRFLDSLKYYYSFGVLYITYGQMWGEIAVWFIVFVIFSTGFGVAFTVLIPGETYRELFARPFFITWRGMVGDFDMQQVLDYFYEEEINGVITPILLWWYMFVSSVVLVNLLIAQMSHVFEDVQGMGKSIWLMQRIELVKEFKDDRDAIPPPLNYLTLLCCDIPWLARKLCKKCFPQPHRRASAAQGGGDNPRYSKGALISLLDPDAVAERGFKAELKGLSIRHVELLGCELRDHYLQASLKKDDVESQLAELHSKQDMLMGQVDHMRSQFAKLNDKLDHQLNAILSSVNRSGGGAAGAGGRAEAGGGASCMRF